MGGGRICSVPSLDGCRGAAEGGEFLSCGVANQRHRRFGGERHCAGGGGGVGAQCLREVKEEVWVMLLLRRSGSPSFSFTLL